MAELPDLSKRVVSISRTYREMATIVLDRAYALRQAGTITPKQYETVYNDHYKRLLAGAMGMVLAADYKLAGELSKHMGAIEAETTKLKNAMGSLDKVGEVIGVAAALIGVTAAVATLITGPNPANAAALGQAVSGAIGALKL